MQCELCGATVAGPGKKVRVEGADLQVCMACARYGDRGAGAPRGDAAVRPVNPLGLPRGPSRPSSGSTTAMSPVGELVDDYGERIRVARVEKGMTTKDLALATKERDLLIKKIEKGGLRARGRRSASRIEKVLGIRLLDAARGVDCPGEEGAAADSTTLGDVLSFLPKDPEVLMGIANSG